MPGGRKKGYKCSPETIEKMRGDAAARKGRSERALKRYEEQRKWQAEINSPHSFIGFLKMDTTVS